METSIACCARSTILPNASSQQYSAALASPRSVCASSSSKVCSQASIFTNIWFCLCMMILLIGCKMHVQSLKASSLFGESLRLAPKSSSKIVKAKSSSLVTKCEIGDSLVSYIAYYQNNQYWFWLKYHYKKKIELVKIPQLWQYQKLSLTLSMLLEVTINFCHLNLLLLSIYRNDNPFYSHCIELVISN